MILVHPFKDQCYNIDTLLDGCYTISEFTKRVVIQSQQQKAIEPDNYKGNALEALVEFLLKRQGPAEPYCTCDYKPVLSGDMGVDGIGVGSDGSPATVQVKFRSNPTHVLTANGDGISNFVAHSDSRYGEVVVLGGRERRLNVEHLLLITTAQTLHRTVGVEMYEDRVRVIGYDFLSKLLDGKTKLWDDFKAALINNRIKPITKAAKSLRKHQVEAVDAASHDFLFGDGKGQIILPTGTGKTVVQAELVAQVVNNAVGKVCVILAPRILLTYQLATEIGDYLSSKNIEAHYLNVSSGRIDEVEFNKMLQEAGLGYRKVPSTTSPADIKKAYEDAKNDGKSLVIVSTYDSAEQIVKAEIPVDLQLNDEAQYLVSTQFNRLTRLNGEFTKTVFCTATQRTTDSDDGLGMNNQKIFGNLLYKQTPHQMIQAGEMVRPALHFVGSPTTANIKSDDYRSMANAIVEAHERHKQQVSKRLGIGAKLLVVCDGQESLINIFEAWKQDKPSIKLFGLSSDFGVWNGALPAGQEYNPSGTNRAKVDFLKSIQNLKQDEDAIIVHVDMIGEGIDVPGITGIMPFRNLGITKFCQNLGRASRLAAIDRQRLYNGDFKSHELNKFQKSCAWVVIPTFLTNSADYCERFKGWVIQLREDYGFSPTEKVVIDDQNGIAEADLPWFEFPQGHKHKLNAHGIEGFLHVLEEQMDYNPWSDHQHDLMAAITLRNEFGFIPEEILNDLGAVRAH